MISADQCVQETNTDATSSKFSCVRAGYYEDEFIDLFASACTPRRNPIINKGYYVRVMIFRRLLREFVSQYSDGCQIVFLGAGTDTNGLRVVNSSQSADVKVFEVDFPEIIRKKVRVIQKHSQRLTFLGDVEASSSSHGVIRFGSQFGLIDHDLRSPLQTLTDKLNMTGFNRAKPTLFICECVLIYMDTYEANAIIQWIATTAATTPAAPRALAIYEQMNSRDAFGRVMVENLNARGCSLRSITDSPSSMVARLLDLGFTSARSELMSHFDPLIPVKRPEIIDELEEYNLLQSHYAFTLCWCGDENFSTFAQKVMELNENQEN